MLIQYRAAGPIVRLYHYRIIIDILIHFVRLIYIPPCTTVIIKRALRFPKIMMLNVIKNESFNSEQALHRRLDGKSAANPFTHAAHTMQLTPTDYIWSVSRRPGYVDIYISWSNGSIRDPR